MSVSQVTSTACQIALHVLNALHFFSGVDWSLVAEHVSMDNAYEQFLDPEASQSQQQGWMEKLKGWVWSQKLLKEDRSAPQTPGTLTPHSHRGAPGETKTLKLWFCTHVFHVTSCNRTHCSSSVSTVYPCVFVNVCNL